MNKSNLLKVFFSLILSVMVILFTTTVNAAENLSNFTDITNQLNGSSGNNSSNTSNSANNSSNSTNNSSNRTNNSTNRTNNNSSSNRNNNTNRNSSVYNNSNLPSTGLGDSLPIAALVVVFGISAIYAYKKIKDYRNI